jgi:hypothetical protein
MKNMVCPYCGCFAELVDSKKVYGKSYGLIYLCSSYPICDAYVGVHRGTKKPLGTMARRYLRELRKECHLNFDGMWLKEKDRRTAREAAYIWLQSVMQLSKKEAHIAKFNEEQCLELLKHYECANSLVSFKI